MLEVFRILQHSSHAIVDLFYLYISPATLHFLNSMMFSVRVPVLSENTYFTWNGGTQITEICLINKLSKEADLHVALISFNQHVIL